MAHVNDATLHALLDGTLEPEERRAVQVHFAECASCSAQLTATQRLLEETGRLVNALQVVPARVGVGQGAGPSEPVVLVPPPPEVEYAHSTRRRAPWVIAAAVILALGAAGFIWSSRHPDDPAAAATGASNQFEPPPGALAAPDRSAPAGPPPDARADSAPVPERAGGRTDTVSTAALSTESNDTNAVAAVPGSRHPASPPPSPRGPARIRDSLALIRERAAAATTELDRQSRQTRAAAATARLSRTPPESAAPSSTPALPTPAPSAPPAPEPPSIDRQAELLGRIGLDEAARVLGEPMHVIDGLDPKAVGTVNPRSVQGADPARPMVRVVYAIPAGLVMLDQQRAGALDSVDSGGARRWIKGGVQLFLHGRGSAEELSDLASRVR